MSADAPSSPQVKATLFRGLCSVLALQGLEAAVLEQVPPETRALMVDLPPATTWLDARRIIDLQSAILALKGPSGLRQIARRGVEQSVIPIVRGTVERVLRVFGISPATVLARMGVLAASTSRGVEYRYTPTSETSGVLELEHVGLRDVPEAPLIATAGGLEGMFELCGVRGTVSDPVMVDNGRGDTCRYTVSWRPRR